MIMHLAASLLSSLFLFASFYPLNWAPLVWIALAPLLFVCFKVSLANAFKFGMLCGLAFWLLDISWIARVSYLGWICLSIYCAVFMGFFAMSVAFLARRYVIRSATGNPMLLFIIPAIWVGFEFVRSRLFSGFPWNQLGTSQFNNLVIIQSAEIGGVYLVSYMIALVNTAIALTAIQYFHAHESRHYRPHPELIISVLILGLNCWYGSKAISRVKDSSGSLVVAAIQPNIQQVQKWSQEWVSEIYARLKRTTQQAITSSAPDLVVWPETALPDFVRASQPSQDLINELLALKTPILVGTMDFDETGSKTNYYNSSLLFTPESGLVASYNKRHLVIFGEYVPMKGLLPFLGCLTPIEGSFTAGNTNTVFMAGPSALPFSALICFEDTIASLARESVRNGARLLINQTNDAWFDPSCASRQQMAHCVFRCIENRVGAVRATNTGLTCFIDRNGVVYGTLKPVAEYPCEPEYSVKPVLIAKRDMKYTFYTRYGDVFALATLAITLPVFAGAMLSFRKRYHSRGTNHTAL